MSGADEFWSYYEAKLDAEAGAIEKARLLKDIKVKEASLVDRPACPGAEIVFHKGRAMYNRSTASDELEAYLKRLQPGLSYGEALAKHASDEVVQGLYADYQSAREDPEPESAGVRKAQEDAAQPGAGIWSTIEKLAAKLRAEQPGVLSEAESIERICFRERPDLYRAYREATME